MYTLTKVNSGLEKACGRVYHPFSFTTENAMGKTTQTHGANSYGASVGLRRAYASWQSLKGRCFNSNDDAFNDYGGRGITVCTRWLRFENFLADMGEPPLHHSIDRINNDGNYEPGNCRWANSYTQMQNRRSCVKMTHNGKTQTVAEWARELEVQEGLLFRRLRLGWSHEQTLTTPLRDTAMATTPGKLGKAPSPDGVFVDKSAMLGRRIGRLTVIEFAGVASNRVTLWKCRCDCGNERTYRRSNLLPGAGKVNTVSCGCHKRDIQSARLTALHAHNRISK